MRLAFRQTHLYRLVNMAERVGFEPTEPCGSTDFECCKTMADSPPEQVVSGRFVRGRNADAARGCGHSDPYRPEAIRTAPKFK